MVREREIERDIFIDQIYITVNRLTDNFTFFKLHFGRARLRNEISYIPAPC